MMRKIAVATGLAGSMLFSAAPAQAAAYFIAGQWYYFSLNFPAEIYKLTGNDLNLVTVLGANIKVDAADVLCVNPQTKRIDPGTGPRVFLSAKSEPINSSDLLKADRLKGNTYRKTASAQNLVREGDRLLTGGIPPAEEPDQSPYLTSADVCKQAQGTSQWLPVFWPDRNCNKGTATTFDKTCYAESEYAVRNAAGQLVYLSDPTKPVAPESDWTFVYLPTTFRYQGFLDTANSSEYAFKYGQCSFTNYSIANPPVGGWASTGTSYACKAISEAEWLK